MRFHEYYLLSKPLGSKQFKLQLWAHGRLFPGKTADTQKELLDTLDLDKLFRIDKDIKHAHPTAIAVYVQKNEIYAKFELPNSMQIRLREALEDNLIRNNH